MLLLYFYLVFAVLTLALCFETIATVIRFLRFRWAALSSLRTKLVVLCLLILFAPFVWQQPWRADRHWTNLEALKERPEWPREKWLTSRLPARLQEKDTLVALSISGGGSRAAYFAATVLE